MFASAIPARILVPDFSHCPNTSKEQYDSQGMDMQVDSDVEFPCEFSDDEEFLTEVNAISLQRLQSLASTISKESYSSIDTPRDDYEEEPSSCWDLSDTSGDETEESYDQDWEMQTSPHTPSKSLIQFHLSKTPTSSRIKRKHLFGTTSTPPSRHGRSHRRMDAFPQEVLGAFRPLNEFCLAPEEKQMLKFREREHNRQLRCPTTLARSRSATNHSPSRGVLGDEAFTSEIWNAWKQYELEGN